MNNWSMFLQDLQKEQTSKNHYFSMSNCDQKKKKKV